MLHLANRMNDKKLRTLCRAQLTTSNEDRLSYAAFKMMDGEYKEAIDSYTKHFSKYRSACVFPIDQRKLNFIFTVLMFQREVFQEQLLLLSIINKATHHIV